MTSSPIFWLLALALAAVTLAVLIVPLLRRRGEPPPEEESAATAVFRDHRRQVEADFAAGAITAAERDVALEDLVARFGSELAEPGIAPTSPPHSDRPQWVSAVIIAAVLPIAAGGLYFILGNPLAITAQPARDEPLVNDPQVLAMVDALAQKLQANPEDGAGWAMLGRSYRALGRFESAALAYGEAVKRLPPTAPLLTDWAESIAQVQGRSLVGQPTELLERALQLDPAYPKALALSGAAAMERNEPATAVALWKRLKVALPPGSPEIAQIDGVIAQMEAAVTSKGAPAPLSKAATITAPNAGAGSTAKGGGATTGGAVEGRVEIDPKLAGKIAPGDTLFIFARDPDGARMPLAAMKVSAGELPRDFALTDAMAMAPNATISAAKRVVIEARVSKSGQAAPQSGDLAGSSAPVAPGTRDVRVTIDRIVR
ncbi:MAG: c-type cytochrome biogenesis protein CcmI [Betaproteobacteria bacterium]